MRLKLDSPAVKQARSLLDRPFESLLPSQDVLADRFAAGEALDVAKYLSSNTGQILQLVQGRIGIQTGIPGNLLGGFAQALSSAALEQSGTNAGLQLAEQSGQLIMDAALQAAGQIPTLGWTMQIAMFIAKLAQQYANDNKPYPPPLRYNQDTDNNEARNALEVVGSVHSVKDVDWTPLFLPRHTGYWDAFGKGAGAGTGSGPDVWELRALDEGDGLGCVPPGLFGSRLIQINDFHAGLDRFSKHKSMTAWYVDHVVDAFQFLPSLTRIGQAVWYAAGSNETAAVWNLDYSKIEQAWQAYFNKMSEFREFLKKNGKDALDHLGQKHKIEYTPLMQGYSLFDAMTHANRVSGKEIKSTPNPVNNTIAGYAKLWCALYDQRAFAMCKTAAVAYASKQQPWFQSSGDRMAALEEGRKDLLQHPAVKAVDPNDVPDSHFRGFVKAAGGGTKSINDFPNWPVIGTSVPQRIETPKPLGLVGAGGPSKGGAGIVMVAAALGLGAYLLTKK